MLADEDIEIKLEPGVIFTRLTETVRNTYRCYLEKQLKENLRAWIAKAPENRLLADADSSVQICAVTLEEKAVRACMMAQLYQRTMVKIIANVQRHTRECRLESHLQKMDSNTDSSTSMPPAHANQTINAKSSTASKATQTVPGGLKKHSPPNKAERSSLHFSIPPSPSLPPPVHDTADNFTSLSLQQKIEMFQARLNKERAAEVSAYRKHAAPPNFANESRRAERHKRRRTHSSHTHSSHTAEMQMPSTTMEQRRLHPQPPPTPQQRCPKTQSATSTPSPAPTAISTSRISSLDSNKTQPQTSASAEDAVAEDDADLIAQELEQLFGEEKTELDEIFGIDPRVPDDPQICSILLEIENAKMPHERPQERTTPPPLTVVAEEVESASCVSPIFQSNSASFSDPVKAIVKVAAASATVLNNRPSTSSTAASSNSLELHRSLWPCELFMQRRRLSASLSRLIEEDLRWHEVIKWKFATLFGEDSDDEFAACSPSIELDEILISSCIRRISPWMVKHLMPPMREGLIANRFLFKKLAKRLGRSIVVENQYPDERTIKHAVEKYFCLHQAVISADDLADIPSISFTDED